MAGLIFNYQKKLRVSIEYSNAMAISGVFYAP